MSAAELTANGGKISSGIAKLVEEAISEMHIAQNKLLALQREQAVGSRIWHSLETIDDHLHNALSKLGE